MQVGGNGGGGCRTSLRAAGGRGRGTAAPGDAWRLGKATHTPHLCPQRNTNMGLQKDCTRRLTAGLVRNWRSLDPAHREASRGKRTPHSGRCPPWKELPPRRGAARTHLRIALLSQASLRTQDCTLHSPFTGGSGKGKTNLGRQKGNHVPHSPNYTLETGVFHYL